MTSTPPTSEPTAPGRTHSTEPRSTEPRSTEPKPTEPRPISRERVAIVHERLTDIAGSEHVIAQLAREYPAAPIHVPFSRPEGIPAGLEGRVHTTALQRPYRLLRDVSYAPLLPAVPTALRSIDLRGMDAAVISHHAFALGAVAACDKAGVASIAYVHSPARWAWDASFRQGEASSLPGRAALSALAAVAKRNEQRYAPRVGAIMANSTAVRDRIRDWWGRDADVVFPPVDTQYFCPGAAYGDPDADEPLATAEGAQPQGGTNGAQYPRCADTQGGAAPLTTAKPGEYFVAVGRMVPYKRVDLAVAAAVAAGQRLVVVGEGRDRARVEAAASGAPSGLIEFTGKVSRADIRGLMRGARALLMPGEEDFGIVPVEAMACGTPVIALAKGGALDTVVPGRSGVLVEPSTSRPAAAGTGAGSLSGYSGADADVIAGFAEALRSFDDSAFTPEALARYASSFSEAEFRRHVRACVDRAPEAGSAR